MPKTGQRPGKGVYKCTKCGERLVLDSNNSRLPPCPSCRATEYVRDEVIAAQTETKPACYDQPPQQIRGPNAADSDSH
jgi:predicted nucleic-acid-binding Zn-ribbon protein